MIPGYAGGPSTSSGQAPSYEEVCTGKTGHAEVVRIEYDAKRISYEDLLTVFFSTHDPTTRNRQGNDVGPQYRSVIFTTNDVQKERVAAIIKELNDSNAFPRAILTEIKPFENFYEAEEYHKDYYNKNVSAPYCQVVIAPKIEKLNKRFQNLIQAS